jgi:hypothetical protein
VRTVKVSPYWENFQFHSCLLQIVYRRHKIEVYGPFMVRLWSADTNCISQTHVCLWFLAVLHGRRGGRVTSFQVHVRADTRIFFWNALSVEISVLELY